MLKNKNRRTPIDHGITTCYNPKCTLCARLAATPGPSSASSSSTIHPMSAEFELCSCSGFIKPSKRHRRSPAKINPDRCKKVVCPFFRDDLFRIAKCFWRGCGSDLDEHLEIQHKDQILKFRQLDFAKVTRNHIFLTTLNGHPMILTIVRQSPGKFSCLAMVTGLRTPCDSHSFELEFFGPVKHHSVVRRRPRLENLLYFDEHLARSNNALVVDVTAMMTLFANSKTAWAQYNFVSTAERPAALVKDPVVEQLECLELECPVCKSPMVAPIMMCTLGHILCGDCKGLLGKCPKCRQPLSASRNYPLEQVANSIKHPCIHGKSDCRDLRSSGNIKKHERICDRGKPCFLKCSKLVVNILDHLLEQHPNNLIMGPECAVLHVKEDEEVTEFYAVCFKGGVFRLKVTYDGDLRFSMEQCWVWSTHHKYEIEVFSTVRIAKRTFISGECHTLGDHANFVKLWKHQVVRFMADDRILFRVHLNTKYERKLRKVVY